MESDDILNIKEVAKYLRMPVSTIYKLAQNGKIPGVKVGKHWRFQKKICKTSLLKKGKSTLKFQRIKKKQDFDRHWVWGRGTKEKAQVEWPGLFL